MTENRINGQSAGILAAYSQRVPADSTGIKSRKLKIDEVNILSSYYDQTADKSAVSIRLAPPGGIFRNHLGIMELRYGHYSETTGLVSNVIALNLTFK